jgi:hypothetical protein
MFLKLLEFVVVFFIVWTGIVQIIVPIMRGRPVFPIFRRQKNLEDKIIKNSQEQAELNLAKEAEDTAVKCCGNCLHPVNRICQNNLSPNYRKEVKQFNTCANHTGRSL